MCREAHDDDLNTPMVIAHLFDAAKIINSATDGNARLTQADIDRLKETFDTMLGQILGIRLGPAAVPPVQDPKNGVEWSLK